MIEIIVEQIKEDEMSTSSDVDMNPTGKAKKKKKCETFSVSDDCYHKFRHGKTKFERWSKYLDLTDDSQKKIYDWAKRHHNGTIILKNSTTGQIRGIRYNRTGGGKWGSINKLKEQVLKTNQKFTVLHEDVYDTIKSIVDKKSMQTVKFADKKSMKVDMTTANAIVKVHDALSGSSQKKFEDMLNKSKATFAQTVDFVWKAIK